MISIGVTGGIGSGKTLICEVFKRLGVPVFHADDEARKLLNSSDMIKEQLIKLYGKDIYKTDSVNSAKLAKIIFKNEKELSRVNQIVHPEVFKAIKAFCDIHAFAAYGIIEAAILFESNADKLVEKIITVYASEDIRIKRVMERDQVGKDTVLDRIKNQISDEERIKRADYVIYNDGRMLLDQILEIHNKLK